MNSNLSFVELRLELENANAFSLLQRLITTDKSVFLLEGFEEWDGTSPYSYLGVAPFETLVVRNGRLEIFKDGHWEIKTGNPFVALEDYLKKYSTPPAPKGKPSFRGGIIGHVGFECTKYFEPALKGTMKEGEEIEALFFNFDKTVALSRDGSHALLTGTLFLDSETLEEGKQRVQKDLERLGQVLRRPTNYRFLSSDKAFYKKITGEKIKPKASLGAKAFVEAVKKAKEDIKAGEIFQCVLSDRFEIQKDVSPLRVYEALRLINPSPFMFYVSDQKQTLFGASPERLVKVSGGMIETNPIAGTRPRGKTKVQDRQFEKHLLKSVKERAEHIMLVDLGRNDIGRVAEPGTVNVEEFMEVKRFSDVMHLISKVRGHLRAGLSPWDAFKSCFPAGTLSGAPKIRALEIITRLEKSFRAFYGGAIIKYEFCGDMDSCITIRAAKAENGTFTFQSGAGIVADSRPAMEYKEVLAKSRAVRRALQWAEEDC